jgi:hypothetical protein
MQAYWTTTKPDGTPITDGRLCRVVDPEDGSTPIRVYGKTQEEIFGKIERTMMTAQSSLTHARTNATPGNGNGGAQPLNGNGAAPPVAANPAILSADETMRLTADLHNPAKSADAAYRLAESERAKRDDAQLRYLAICRDWSQKNPQFYGHQLNRNLLITSALLAVGNDVSRITLEVLDNTYRYLEGRGDLLTENDVAIVEPVNRNQETPPSEVQPGGNLEVVPARPRNGVVNSTGHRSNRLGAPQLPQWKPKYTLEEINKLSTKDTLALNQPGHPRHKEYVEACDYWFSGARAATA